jgi:SNF2 family DNA or RNA helicase
MGRDFSDKLYTLFIQRTKEVVLKDELPMKDERIVFCAPSDLQVRLYRHIIQQPDFVLLSQSNGPCECGVNRKFFFEYQQLKTDDERLEYQRRHKKDIVTRSKCCFKIPRSNDSEDGINPGAVLWRQMHPDGVACPGPKPMCPYCITFAAMDILYKLSSHVALLQVEAPLDYYGIGSVERKKAEHKLERAKHFLPPDVVQSLPGGYIRHDGMMNDHFSLSGKMAVLHKLLQIMYRQQGRVLLFSASTKMLDLIQNYVKSEGYTHLRMDGSTTTDKRKELVDEFQGGSSKCFIFLLSTKAMGLGLNLTEANFVIIFDVDWSVCC